MVPNEEKLVHKARTLDYPTPFFYTSKNILDTNYKTFAHLFRNSEVYYAIKANSDSKILAHLDRLGSGFEAASYYEIEQLLDVGVDPHKIIYGTSVKSISHIKQAAAAGVTRFAADSREEVDKIADYAPGSRVFIRARVNDADSVFAFSERFGAPIEVVKGLVMHAKHRGLKTYGISFHVGSQATHAERWADAIRALTPTIERLDVEGIRLEMIDIGGGFPVIYSNHKELPHLREIAQLTHEALHKLPYELKIVLEPGRGMIATSTVMVSEVISRTIRNGKVWLVLDGGIYNGLYEAMIHQGSTQYDVHPAVDVEGEVEYLSSVLTGPTGDSLDIIARDVLLPAFINIGDKLIFENAGAYTVTMASPFNGFPKPALHIG